MTDRLPGLPAYDAPPLASQATDLLIFSTPDMWFNEICTWNDALIKKIEGFGTAVQHKIDGLSTADAAIIGGLIGGAFGGPLGGLLGGLGGALGIGEIKDWLHGKLGDLLKALWDAQKKLVDAMQAAIDGIFGNPQKLMGLGTGYQTAQTKLNNAAGDVSRASNTVAIFWQSRGFSAYSGAATGTGGQKDAMAAMATKMGSASHLMADAAERIQQCWSDIIQALVALITDIAGDLVGDIDITKLPTAEVTAPCQIIIDAVNFLNAVVKSMRDVNITARNTGVMNWTELTGGDVALVNGAWPRPDGLSSNQYGNDHNWKVTDR